MEQQLLFPEMLAEHPSGEQQINTAKDIIRKAVELAREKDTPEHKTELVCCYSCGKDSNLLLCLMVEVCKEMGELDRIQVLTTITGYETEMYKGVHYEEYVLEFIKKQGLKLRIHRPERFWRYSTVILGQGRETTSHGFLHDCTGHWKMNRPTDDKRDIYFIGVRCDEGSDRKRRYTSDYGCIGKVVQVYPIREVETDVLWEHLALNMDKHLLYPYEDLAEYYKNKQRDGCWMCWARMANKTQKHRPIPIWADAVNHIATFFELVWQRYEKRICDAGYESYGKKPKTRLWIRQTYYCLLKALERKYNHKYYDDIQEDIIRECWNFAEWLSDKTGVEDPVISHGVFNKYCDEYKPLKPYLIDYISWKGNRKNFKV